MEGPTRHEGQPLDPNPRGLFDVSENPFAFSPGQLNKLFNPKSLRAFYALGRLEGLEKASRSDRLFHDEEASGRNARMCDDASLVSTLGRIEFEAVNEKTPKWLSRDSNPDTAEGKLVVEGLHGRNISDTNKLETTPKLSLFTMAWKISPVASVLMAFGVMLLILDECHQTTGVNLMLPELTLPIVASLAALLSIVSYEVELRHWTSEKRKTRKLIRRVPGQPEPGDVVPGPGIACAEFVVAACDDYVVADYDEFSLAAESDLFMETSMDDMYKALNEPRLHRGLKRADRMGSFILSVSRVVDGVSTSLVTAFSQHTGSLSGPTPIEEGIVHQPTRFHYGPIDNCLVLFGAFADIVLDLLCLSDTPTKLAGDAKNGPGAALKISFKEYCHTLIASVFLTITRQNRNATVSYGSQLPSFLMLGVFILQHRRRLEPVLDQIRSFYQSVVSNAKKASSTNARHRRQTHWKPALILLALLHGTPVVAVAWAPVRALRIASGITASSAAAAVVPLRTIDGVPSWAWIS